MIEGLVNGLALTLMAYGLSMMVAGTATAWVCWWLSRHGRTGTSRRGR